MSIKNVGIIIVEKLGSLKSITIKDYNEEELYKKTGFKSAEGFGLQTEWPIKMDGRKYFLSVYGKKDGKANMENKYDFPPPIDNTLFFGSCAIVGKIQKDDGSKELISVSLEQWEKFYEKLFGGFEDLKVCVLEDEYEEDELENVAAEKKTKAGYLKDGFVVDSDTDEKEDEYETEDEDEDEDETEETDETDAAIDQVVDIGSELSEESYSDDEADV